MAIVTVLVGVVAPGAKSPITPDVFPSPNPRMRAYTVVGAPGMPFFETTTRGVSPLAVGDLGLTVHFHEYPVPPFT